MSIRADQALFAAAVTVMDRLRKDPEPSVEERKLTSDGIRVYQRCRGKCKRSTYHNIHTISVGKPAPVQQYAKQLVCAGCGHSFVLRGGK
jgi:hypothetical protein